MSSPILKTYPTDQLLKSLELVGDLSLASRVEDNRAHDGYRRNQGRLDEAFGWLLVDFKPVRTAWLSHIEPGGYIKPHKDAGPHYERWQIPIQPAGTFTVDGVELDQQPGVPFLVEHWKWHEIRNDTDRPRIHIVLDRDVLIRTERTEFELAQS